MTIFFFLLGILPLVFASGAGAVSRQSLGTAVFGGMIMSTILTLLLTPILFVILQRLRERKNNSEEIKMFKKKKRVISSICAIFLFSNLNAKDVLLEELINTAIQNNSNIKKVNIKKR